MTLQELCELQHRALLLSGCWCTWTAAYAGMSTKREIVQQCSRCKAIDEFEAMQKGAQG